MLNFKLFVKADQEDPKDVLAAVDAAASQLPPAAAAPPAADLAPPAAPVTEEDPVEKIKNKLTAIVGEISSAPATDRKLDHNVKYEGAVEDGVMNDG